jgi:hypothetical protein
MHHEMFINKISPHGTFCIKANRATTVELRVGNAGRTGRIERHDLAIRITDKTMGHIVRISVASHNCAEQIDTSSVGSLTGAFAGARYVKANDVEVLTACRNAQA